MALEPSLLLGSIAFITGVFSSDIFVGEGTLPSGAMKGVSWFSPRRMNEKAMMGGCSYEYTVGVEKGGIWTIYRESGCCVARVLRH